MTTSTIIFLKIKQPHTVRAPSFLIMFSFYSINYYLVYFHISDLTTKEEATLVEVILRHFHRCCYRSSPAVVLLLEGTLVSLSLAMDERGGHESLRGSDRRNVIPYIYGRTELYCSSLPCLILPFRSPL
jgi:hypothetical protein